MAFAACLSVWTACLWAQPWTVREVRQFGGWGNYSFTAANASGDIFVGSGDPPLSPPTLRYGKTGSPSVYVSKVNAMGAEGFSVQIGGAYRIDAVAADSAGNVYFAGAATLTGLPVTPGAYRTAPTGDYGGYACELKPDGALAFCTYLDPAGIYLTGIAVDAAGNLCIGGVNQGAAAPTPGALALGGTAFVSKLAAGGERLLFAAQLGTGAWIPGPIATDVAGNIYVSGTTESASFLAGVSADGTALLNYSEGKTGEKTAALAVDRSANVYLTGREPDGSLFVRKYGSGLTVVYEKFFGAKSSGAVSLGPANVPLAMAVDNLGNASVVGYTNAVNFPLHQITQSCDLASFPGGENGFLLRLSPTGDVLQSTYLAPGGVFNPAAIVTTPGGAYVAGDLTSGYGAAYIHFAALTLAPITGSVGTLQLGCMGNAATFAFAGISPGEVVSLFGEGIGPATGVSYQLDAAGRLSNMVAETQVTFDGIAAPLLYVQASQINAIAPWGIAGKISSEICVTYRSAKANCIQTAVAAAAPGVFVTSSGYAAAVNEDQTINSPENPAPMGSIVSIYATGLGPVTPVPVDGTVTGLPLPTQIYPVQYMIPRFQPPDVPGEILYVGPAPFEPAGLTQINIRLQQSSAGYLQVRMLDGSVTSSPIFVVAAKAGQ